MTHLLHGDPLIVNERFPDDPWSTLNLDSEVHLMNRAPVLNWARKNAADR